MTKQLTLEELERFLWQSADILRGSIDSSDYKNYIFGLLFLKRLSDVFEEESEKLLAQGESSEVAWEDPDGSDGRYHRRSNVESTISAKKRKFASRVRGRSPTSQRLEENLSWVGYNFSLVPRAYHEFGVKPPFSC